MNNEPDKKSIKYFMKEMTQEEFEKICKRKSSVNDFETGWNRDDRYILNKIRYNQIQNKQE
jgi:hypothetical protein